MKNSDKISQAIEQFVRSFPFYDDPLHIVCDETRIASEGIDLDGTNKNATNISHLDASFDIAIDHGNISDDLEIDSSLPLSNPVSLASRHLIP